MKRTYKYPLGKNVYYFRPNTEEIRSGTIHEHYKPLAGEVYLIEPDNPTEGEEKRLKRLQAMRKQKFNDDYQKPVTDIVDVRYVGTQTSQGLMSVKKEAKSFLTIIHKSRQKNFTNQVNRYKKSIKKIKEYKG